MANTNLPFNKVTAFDELSELIQIKVFTPSESMKAMQRAQDFLKKIHDDAFAEGFEKGLDAALKEIEP